jgi:hypothetical protein
MQGIQRRTKLFQNLKQPIPFPQGVNKYTDLQPNFLVSGRSAVKLDNYYQVKVKKVKLSLYLAVVVRGAVRRRGSQIL